MAESKSKKRLEASPDVSYDMKRLQRAIIMGQSSKQIQAGDPNVARRSSLGSKHLMADLPRQI